MSDAEDQPEREGPNAGEIDELPGPAQDLWRDDLFREKQSDLTNGGAVYTAEIVAVPGDGVVPAVFRY